MFLYELKTTTNIRTIGLGNILFGSFFRKYRDKKHCQVTTNWKEQNNIYGTS